MVDPSSVESVQTAPPVDQICIKVEWQMAPSGGQILTYVQKKEIWHCMLYHLVINFSTNKILTLVTVSKPWVRCAPGNVFFYFYRIFIEYQNVILATILGESVRIKISLWNINFKPGWKGGHFRLLLGLRWTHYGRNKEVWWGGVR